MHAYTENEQQNCRTFSRGRLISKTTFVVLLLRSVSSYRTVAHLFNNYLPVLSDTESEQSTERDITNITKQQHQQKLCKAA
jgi:hypothetical protein